MPIALSKAPIVVGIKHTVKAIRVEMGMLICKYDAIGYKVTMTIKNIIVKETSRVFNAISLGVFCLDAPSTKEIILSRNEFPCSDVISTLIQSETTVVPPVTDAKSPPLSFVTGADSPVMADSSMLAIPSIISPS